MPTESSAVLTDFTDLPLLRDPMGPVEPVAENLAMLRTLFVNVLFIGRPGAGDRQWVLVDTGIFGAAPHIRQAASRRFGGSRPAAILLTHGHFDHVGAVRELAEHWDVPVYAHPLELPYLTGRSAYPPPDPTVGGGAMAALSFLYPKGPIDLGDRVRPLPEDGTVPHAPEWRWIHTPGHAAGHVSLFRDQGRVLVAGDAFVTTDQESALSVLAQRPVVQGPPAYFTPDWIAAGASVRKLADLNPEMAVTGHGVPLGGEDLRESLHRLAAEFHRLAVPVRGRYVGSPAVADESGVVYVPPAAGDQRNVLLLAMGGAVALGLWAATRGRRPRARRRRR